jgi:hypothetical protein
MANTQLPATSSSSEHDLTLGEDPVARTLEAMEAQKQLSKVQGIYDNIRPNGRNAGYTSDVAKEVVQHEAVVEGFKSYMKDRGESVDTHRAAAERQVGASDRDTFAANMVSWAQAGEESFNSIVAENGDSEAYKQGVEMDGEPGQFRELYTVDMAAKSVGYSLEERASGTAEAGLRHSTNAGETESTRDALYRWSNEHVAKKKEREDAREKISKFAESNFFDVGADDPLGDKHNPSDLLEKMSPPDRARAVQEQRRHTAHLEKTHGYLRGPVRKMFNTVLEADGKPAAYKDAESFGSMKEMGEALSALNDEDFAKANEMLHKTAKLRGVNEDDTMSAIGKSFMRSVYNQAGAITPFQINKSERDQVQLREILSSGGANKKKTPQFYAVEVTDNKGKVLGYDFTPRMSSAKTRSLANTIGELPLVGTLLGQTAQTLSGIGDWERTVAEAQVHANVAAEQNGHHAKIITDRPTLEKALASMEDKTRYFERAGRIRNWRAQATTVTSGNRVKDAFTTGLAGSLPEMATYAFGGMGLGLATAARYEQNMGDIRESLPRDRWEANKVNAMAGATIYSALGKLQLNTALRGMGRTSMFLKTKSAVAQGVARAGYVGAMETVQEMGQEASFAVVSNLYGAVAEDIKDFGPALSENGWLTHMIENADDTAIAMLPFALMGGLGKGVSAHMDIRTVKSNLDNPEYLESLNIEDKQVENLRKMKPLEAAEWIKVHREEVFSNVLQHAAVITETASSKVTFHSEKGNIIVTANGKSQVAKSPEEAAEHAMALDPTLDKVAAVKGIKAMVSEKSAADLKKTFEAEIVKNLKTKQKEEGLNDLEAERLQELTAPKVAPDVAKHNEEVLGNDKTRKQVPLNENPDPTFEMPIVHPAMKARFENFHDKYASTRPPTADKTTHMVSKAAKRRYTWSKALSGRKIGSKDLDIEAKKAEDATHAAQSSMNNLANAVDRSIRTEAIKSPNSQRDTIVADLNALADRAMKATPKDRPALLKQLPPETAALVVRAREELDTLSQHLIDSGFISKDLAKILGDNVGVYMQRQFRVHQDTGWNYAGVKQNSPQVLADGIAHIAKTNKAADVAVGAKLLSDAKYEENADNIAREMLDESENSGTSFVYGSAQAGKANIKNFIKRKEIDPEIRALLGEVTDVSENIKNTGGQQSAKIEAYKFQQSVAKLLIAAGLASRTPNPKLSIFEKNQVGGKDGQANTATAGFGKLYAKPEILAELNEYLMPTPNGKSTMDIIMGLVRTSVTVGKFNQVVLSPQAYASNFLGGAAFELAAGRFMAPLGKRGRSSLKAYSDIAGKDNIIKHFIGRQLNKIPVTKIQSYADGILEHKNRTNPYTLTESMEYGEMTVDEVIARDGFGNWRLEQLEAIATDGKLLNNSVWSGDMQASGEIAGEKFKAVMDGGGALYQITDNAAKAHALSYEMMKWMDASKGDVKMSEVIAKAVSDTRKTTQNYDLVHPFLKKASANGMFAGSYISFAYELVRNTYNNFSLAKSEIASGNPVLVKNGYKRLVGVALTGVAMGGVSSGITALMSGMGLGDQDLLRETLPEWNEYTRVAMTGVDDEGHLGFFDGQYIIPQFYWYNALSQLGNEGSWDQNSAQMMASLIAPFADQNIFTNLIIGSFSNQKSSGAKIYNEDTDEFWEASGKLLANGYNAMFKPGAHGFLKKALTNEEVNSYGGVVHKGDFLLNLVGIRMNRMDITSEGFGKSQFSKYARLSASINRDLSAKKRADMSEKELATAKAKGYAGRADLNTQLSRTVRMLRTDMMAKHISKDHIRHWAKKAKLPTWQRAYFEELLAD